MLTLYFAPGSSAMAPHIALHEVGAPFESRPLSFHKKQNRDPAYLAVNPEGKLPTLLIDGTVMVLGTIYVVFVANNFLAQFEGFLITLGVPIAAWCGIMLADIMLRRKDYAEPELYDPRGRYGDVRLAPLAIMVVAAVIGWGLVTNVNASWLTWQGYLLGPLGLGGKNGAWAFANLGVLVALVIGFVAGWACDVAPVRAQEARPVLAPATVTGTGS